ncbi:MAG TPA: (Fe-S)-binding protein, partial [Bdellovibrionota bacterium]|nr:(Fe-S)-binding protein [Bdellovibrionota bacterium]
MTWQTFAFFAVAGGAFGLAGLRLRTLYRLMRATHGKDMRWSEVPARIGTFVVNVIGQASLFRKKAAGLMHAMIFWGFIIITLGTIEQFLSTIHEALSLQFIGHTLYAGLVFLQDLFTLLVLVGVSMAAWRRFVVRPEYLGQSRDANIILLLTTSLMVAIFLMNGFFILGRDPWYAEYMPFSSTVASGLRGLGLGQEGNLAFGTLFKWVHMCIVLGFAVYIPGSKHLHVLAAAPNTFFRTLRREKGMKPIHFEDETVVQYGAAKITDLSWKDTLDFYSCTECGRCQELCPAWNTQKPLSPKNLIVDLKHGLFKNKDAILAGNSDAVTPVIDENVTEDVIWACTSCRACEIACPVFIEHTDKIYEVRRNLVLMESRFPTELQTVFKNMETNGTPWAFAAADRGQWAEGLNVPTMAESSQVDVLLWVGCAGSYDDRNKRVLRSFVSLLKKAGVRFAILGAEEQCTGDPARRVGNEYLFQSLAKTNVETLKRYGVSRVVTACPHCFNSLKNEYKPFGGEYEVFHHTQFIAKLLSEGRIKPAKAVEETITFHDSCYLGRWNNVYGEPRSILQSLPSARLVEMKSNHDKSLCCGAG